MQIQIEERVLHFKQPAGTSRGVYTTRKSWFVKISDGTHVGIGECAPLPQLSCDDLPDYGEKLRAKCEKFAATIEQGDAAISAFFETMRPYPSMLFGFETALLSLTSHHSPLTSYSTPHSVAARWAFPSTDWCGWAATRRCSSASSRSWNRNSAASS